MPVARLADALPIMADVALRPTFPKDELERQRQRRLTAMLQGRDDAPTISSVAFSRVLYGKAHHGTPQFGTASVRTFTVDDLRGPSVGVPAENATLIAVGDITTTRRCRSRRASARDDRGRRH